ncbi:MAG: hypothetical protein HY216_14720 [Candidatus Rokubacteria bacterium]|nr:hypothetical protein [Candidatus Rokubacteria bacterium]
MAEAAGRISRTWQNQVVLCDMAAPRRDLWRLAARTRLRAVPMKVEWPSASVAAKPVFDRRRDGLAGLSGQDDFQRTWIKTLSHNFPTLYLEGYEKARAMTLQRHGRLPSAIVSETGWYSSEPFKFLAAEASELGVCLLAAQHGGSYGIRRAIPPERHEADSSDAYVVWGWGAVGDGRYLNWPAPRPSALRIARRRAARRRVGTSLLFVATADPRYLHYFHSRPTGSQWESYFEWQHRFLAALPAAVRSRVRFRANAGDFGQMVWPRIRERYPEIRPGSDGRFRGWMERSRLIVFDHCGTGMLEALNANVPTVAFWDPERWEVRAGAEADCHRLREVGILHDSPENAAAHVTVLFDAPERWWGEEIVQTARLAFARRYGFETEDWVGYWARELTGFCYGHRNRK